MIVTLWKNFLNELGILTNSCFKYFSKNITFKFLVWIVLEASLSLEETRYIECSFLGIYIKIRKWLTRNT